MTRLVIDASTAVALVVGRHPSPDAALALLEDADSVLAPRLYWAEIANALWKYARRSRLPEAAAIDYLEQTPVEFFDDPAHRPSCPLR